MYRKTMMVLTLLIALTMALSATSSMAMAMGGMGGGTGGTGGTGGMGGMGGNVGNGGMGGTNACIPSGLAAMTSCKLDAQSSYALDLANCKNLTKTDQPMCKQEASTAQKNSMRACNSQMAARMSQCGWMGNYGYAPVMNSADFVQDVTNPFMPLVPGTTFMYNGATSGGLKQMEFNVTGNTSVILGVTTTEVDVKTSVAGNMTENDTEWFAQDTTGNVWLFGKNANQMSDGLVVGVAGSWTAGVGGAMPGIVMEATPTLGNAYRQDFSIGMAEDMATVMSITESVSVPYGSWANCLKTSETTPLAPSAQRYMYYCSGVGNVQMENAASGDTLQLITVTTGP